ncbi:MAG: hypothetical protein K6F33_11465, partial [Bacteroidales bacterium]|nr:hypothetical protein [Bacteroidales bacterium]
TLNNVFKQLYGPMVLPRRGMSITLNYSNFYIYKDLIAKYEGVDIQQNSNGYTVDGRSAHRYTFKRNYIYLSNDNSSILSDSRSLGPLPAEVILGKLTFKF